MFSNKIELLISKDLFYVYKENIYFLFFIRFLEGYVMANPFTEQFTEYLILYLNMSSAVCIISDILYNIFKDGLPYLLHSFRNKYFNKISLANLLYF